jgi:DNA repair exonuclease SbcCD ATPase subunit
MDSIEQADDETGSQQEETGRMPEETETDISIVEVSESAQPEEQAPAPPVEKRSRLRQAARTALGWFLGILAIFLIGALTVAVFFYLPARQSLDSTSTSLSEANQLISEQESRIAAVEAENSTLEEELERVRLLGAVTQVELEILEASLAVVENNFSRASLSIDQAESALTQLADTLDGKHSEVFADLQKKLAQARSKAQGNLRTALPDLRTLSGDLVKLKDALVTSP